MKKKMKTIALILLILVTVISAVGCGDEKMKTGYTSITMEEAKAVIEDGRGLAIVDVRRPDEYSQGHIPNAVNIPLETIGEKKPAQLPDTSQKILVYCRSGVRSKEAAEKLAQMGYNNIVEIGGINDWTGPKEV